MILADTSVMVQTLRDRGGRLAREIYARFPDDDIVVTPFTEFELLRGARDERNWRRLEAALGRHPVLSVGAEDGRLAARIYYDMRRRGLTVDNLIDCFIAQSAISHGVPLLHRDRDFESIRVVRPELSLIWLE